MVLTNFKSCLQSYHSVQKALLKIAPILVILLAGIFCDFRNVYGQTEWMKHSKNPVIDIGFPGTWDELGVFASSVTFDGTKYHLWYTGFDVNHARTGYANSLDGISWIKHANNPVLELGDPGTWEELWVAGPTVVFDGFSYKMWYTGADSFNCRIGYAESMDGIYWTKSSFNPVLDLGDSSAFDASSVAWPTVIYDGSIYKIWYHGVNHGKERIGYASSSDGINWTKYESNPIIDLRTYDVWRDLNLAPRPILYDGANYKMWYRGYDADGTLRINYATSPDGINWTKSLGSPMTNIGIVSSWDLIVISTPVVLFDGTGYKMWYNGFDGLNVRIGYATALDSSSIWQKSIIVQDANNGIATLTFGQALTATVGLDPFLGEIELPPTPPGNIFDARFELDVSPPIFAVKDFRSYFEDLSTTWKIKFQTESTNFPVTLTWDSTGFPEHDFYLKDALTGAIINVNMKTQDSLVVTGDSISSLIITSQATISRNVNIAPGWNIISVPLQASDMSVATLFPDAASSAFQFNNGYVSVTTLSTGVGYWLKFNSAQDYPIQGMIVSPQQMPVNLGWNIIGPFESDVPVAQISSEPPGIIQSDFFEFDNGYKSVTTLEVGKGYWVKVSQSGTLRVQQNGGSDKKSVAFRGNDFSPERLNTLPQILINDSNGRTGTLYLASNHDYDNDNGFELPPVPPTGIFDVRFSSDRLVENLNNAELEVLISSAQFPIKIKAVNLGDMQLAVKDAIGESVLNQTISEQSEIVIPRVLNKILIKSALPSLLPSQYQLNQNYPNPFNPTSVISYALPEAGQVRISVYNILGKKVADLVNETQPAGYHQIEIDARNYASGIYYYVMNTKGFSAVKKMAIVK